MELKQTTNDDFMKNVTEHLNDLAGDGVKRINDAIEKAVGELKSAQLASEALRVNAPGLIDRAEAVFVSSFRASDPRGRFPIGSANLGFPSCGVSVKVDDTNYQCIDDQPSLRSGQKYRILTFIEPMD